RRSPHDVVRNRRPGAMHRHDARRPVIATRSRPWAYLRRTNGRTTMSPIPTLRPLGETLGTEVCGINLASALDAPTIAWIRRTFAEHPVLVFRDQDLGANELADFGRVFGVPRKHSLVKYRHADNDDVSWITNVDADGKVDWFGVKRATDWHTDSTF